MNNAQSSVRLTTGATIRTTTSISCSAKNLTVTAPLSQAQTAWTKRRAGQREVRRVLVELFNVSPNEMVSLHLLRQQVHSQISTEEIIAVLKELEGDEYIMYRDEEGAVDGPAAHRI